MIERYYHSHWRKCPVCGKEFYLAPENVYKLVIKEKKVHFCSWTCYRKAQKALEAKQNTQKKYKKRDEL